MRIRSAFLGLSFLLSAPVFAAPSAAFAEASQGAETRRPAAEFRLPDEATQRYSLGLRHYRGFRITPVSLSGITCRIERGDFSVEVECQRAEHLIDLAYNREALARRQAANEQR